MSLFTACHLECYTVNVAITTSRCVCVCVYSVSMIFPSPYSTDIVLVSVLSFQNSHSADDSAVTSDVDIINDLNANLDWWEYQRETWLAIGM